MTAPNRRDALGLGLAAGAAALLGPAAYGRDQPRAAAGTLRYRVRPDYRPDVSKSAKRQLTRATLDFLNDTHPAGMTLSLWDLNPRDIPFLEQHIERIVEAVFVGVRTHLPLHPVEPVLVVSLIYNESRFSPVAMSQTGALGMAQFMPNTAEEYGLEPIAQIELWRRYRERRASERSLRAGARQAFLKRFGISAFTSRAVIDQALDSGSLAALAEFQQLLTADKPELDLLREYRVAVNEQLAAVDFFDNGEAALARIDARTGYAAVTAAVDYLSRRLDENSGMTSSAVAAYNAGPASVRERNPRSVLYGYGDLPAYPETVRYVQRVLVVYSKLSDRL